MEGDRGNVGKERRGAKMKGREEVGMGGFFPLLYGDRRP